MAAMGSGGFLVLSSNHAEGWRAQRGKMIYEMSIWNCERTRNRSVSFESLGQKEVPYDPTILRSLPMPSISPVTTSPVASQRCGDIPSATPDGVPVAITSPGSRVSPAER